MDNMLQLLQKSLRKLSIIDLKTNIENEIKKLNVQALISVASDRKKMGTM